MGIGTGSPTYLEVDKFYYGQVKHDPIWKLSRNSSVLESDDTVFRMLQDEQGYFQVPTSCE